MARLLATVQVNAPHDMPPVATIVGGGLGLVAVVTSEAVTGWARAASAVLGACILLVTLVNAIRKGRKT